MIVNRDDDFDSSVRNRPWSKFVYTMEVYIKEGKLYCSCGLAKSLLLPCAHILCVKIGVCTENDCRFRYSLVWHAGRIPLSQLFRSRSDQDFGVSLEGVEQTELTADDDTSLGCEQQRL
jgi:hypothetical protein